MNNKYYVYALINSLSQTIFYIGKGYKRRMYSHVLYAKRKTHYNKHLENKILNILNNNGKIIYKILFDSYIEDETYDVEEILINELDISTLCNVLPGGRNPHGYTQSEQTIQKYRNKTCSKKTKRLLSEYNKKRFSDINERLKTSLAVKKAMTLEVRQKISKAKKGKSLTHIVWNKGKKSRIKKICKHCEKIFYVYKYKNKQRFCSRKCSNSSIDRFKQRVKRITKICPECNKKFIVTPGRAFKIFCSRRCHNNNMRIKK